MLLADKKKTLKLSSTVPFTVRDGLGKTHTLAAGDVTSRATLALTVDGQSTPQPLTAPLTFRAGARRAAVAQARRTAGRSTVDVVDGKLRAINVVGLEQYLYGVVPSEMPSDWSAEALKAQAVAARSYAMATRQVGAPYDVFDDTRSQMYLGLSHEDPATNAAVDATKGQVLYYGGKVATTYFSSTSGGADRVGRGLDRHRRCRISSRCPIRTTRISPYHDWGPVPVTGKTVVQALKLPGPITDVKTTPQRGGSRRDGRPLRAGHRPAVAGTKLRGALGLRSTWFTSASSRSLRPSPSAPVVYGSTISLTGVVRGVSGVSFEQRPSATPWQTVAPVTPARRRHACTLTAKPTITTDYRLATSTAAAGCVHIKVMPLVTVTSVAGGAGAGHRAAAPPGRAGAGAGAESRPDLDARSPRARSTPTGRSPCPRASGRAAPIASS